ncbi:hypothetical protein NZK32_09850 [Cyanobium sp. FGCU-52]|nr:hypothetical protein [Cyanobium sp. FGCU52]
MSENAEQSIRSRGSHGESNLEQVAEIVHCAMRWYREGTTQRWQGGNSFAEDRARLAARRIERVFRPTLTDEEREALEKAIGRELDAEWYGGPEPDRVVALRGLLARLG